MSIVTKRAEFGDPRNSFSSAATFRRVLKGFEIGGLPYTEVQFQLKRLLATGVSPGELREVLRRSELIEPLPEYAYREVLGLLDEAIEQDAALHPDTDGAIEQEEELDPVALAAELKDTRDALESEQARVREAEELLSERIIADEAVRSRLDIAMRESERYQVELRAARNSMASRDKVTAQMRLTLDARDAELAAMRREHDAEMQALQAQAAAAATDLTASRDALDKERRKSQEIERSLLNSNSLSGAARESLASREKALAEARQALAERDAQMAALQREQTGSLVLLESERRKSQEIEHSLLNSNSLSGAARESLASRDKALAEMRQTLAERDAQLAALKRESAAAQSNLQASRTQAISLVGDLAAARGMLESERRKSQETEHALGANAEEKLQVAQKRVETLKLELEKSQDAVNAGNAQVASLQASLRDNNALIEKLGASVRSEAKRATQWQAAAQQRESEAPQILPRIEIPPRVQNAQTLRALPKFPLNFRGWRGNLRVTPRAVWIGAAIVVLAAAIWFSVHRLSTAPSSAAASSPALMQPATTAAPPIGPIDQESATTENSSAIEKRPPAAEKAVAAGSKPSSDFQRCRAGGIDACYDAIRWKPSDPSLLSALGDALLRANRPNDALRAYRRVATLAPDLPGVAAKISAIEAKLSGKPAPASVPRKRSSNATPQPSH